MKLLIKLLVPAIIVTAILFLTLVLTAQQPPDLPDPPAAPEAYPGQRSHQEPPDGFMCVRQTIRLDVPPEHACSCERMYSPEDGHVMEDKDCTVWCWPNACGCGIGGHPMAAPEPPR